MARIYQRTGKKGTLWYLDFQVDGRRVRKRVGKSKRLAELALADIEVKLERKEAGFTAKDRDLKDFIREYLAYAKGNKAPKSFGRDELTLRHFTDFIKADKLGAVTAPKLEAYKTHRREQGAKPATLNRELNTIKAMFNKAVAWGALPASPARSVQKFREPRKPVRYLSREEIRVVLAAANDRLARVIETFLHTGLRRDELVHLTWQDVDFKNKVVSVQAKDDWHPKDYEARHIPMTDRLLQVLQAVPKRSDSFVFTNSESQPLNGDVLTHDFIKLVKGSGIKHASIHTLRHTFASHLVMSGADLYTVQKLLGHSSIKTTEIYAHLAPDYLRSAIEKLHY
ncbi:MAG: tyrosine-type recombinase/integrase [Elusimicrobia bacterium]|nr:tyrosine-type recombinase/integrase [Elusimicrobiota bacterium]